MNRSWRISLWPPKAWSVCSKRTGRTRRWDGLRSPYPSDSSGLINGLMQCDCPHIIKGRIIKERHERREENHSERGELISTDVIETITNRMVFNILTPTGFRSLV